MPDAVQQNLTGNGNQFNIDQVNNLVDKDYLNDPKVENDAKFEADLKADGGWADAKIDDVTSSDSTVNDVGNATASADGVASLEAFNQNISMDANIQYNSIDLQVAGHDVDIDSVL